MMTTDGWDFAQGFLSCYYMYQQNYYLHNMQPFTEFLFTSPLGMRDLNAYGSIYLAIW